MKWDDLCDLIWLLHKNINNQNLNWKTNSNALLGVGDIQLKYNLVWVSKWNIWQI